MTTDRATIPSEFYDITSGMVLVQPEPQFFYAMLAKLCLSSTMDLGAYAAPQLGLGAGGGSRGTARGVPNVGMPYTSAEYDRLALMPPDANLGEACIVVDELASQAGRPNPVGHTVRINRPKFIGGTFTEGSRIVNSAQTISTTAVDLSGEQATITIKRYAGPHDGTAPAPIALDRFDCIRAVHSMAQVAGKSLQRDFDKWLDRVIAGLFDVGSASTFLAGAPAAIWPAGFTSDNGSIVAGDMPGDAEMLSRADLALKNGNVPQFPNGRYVGVVTPKFAYDVTQDPQWSSLVKYFPSVNPIFAKYLGTYKSIDVFESTTLTSTANGNTPAINVQTSHVFGPGAIGLGVARLPEVASSTDDNYGEIAKFVWLAYLAFTTLDARFVAQIHTS